MKLSRIETSGTEWNGMIWNGYGTTMEKSVVEYRTTVTRGDQSRVDIIVWMRVE